MRILWVILLLVGCTAHAVEVPNKYILAFKAVNVCPSSGEYVRDTDGKCVGYTVAPIVPLECGGEISLFNLQWVRNDKAAERSVRLSLRNCKDLGDKK